MNTLELLDNLSMTVSVDGEGNYYEGGTITTKRFGYKRVPIHQVIDNIRKAEHQIEQLSKAVDNMKRLIVEQTGA